MVAFDREAGDGAEQIGLGAVIGEMLDRLVDQILRLLARAVLPEDRDRSEEHTSELQSQ